MYAQVVVLTYQPPDINSYTYEIPKTLKSRIKIGQLIKVPFGNRNPQGIITKFHSKKPIVTTKPIASILLENPILLPYQIELLEWMSFYYVAPMANCLDTILPEIPKRLENYEITKSKNPQSLILVPTINQIPETLAKFPKAKNHEIFHNELKMSEKFATWTNILSGKTDYVFGSRSAIFSPCPNLKDIIIYDEHDGAYKDVRSPYFDTLTVAQKISQHTKAQIKIVDSTPKITTYSTLKNHIKSQKFNTKTKMVSMADEKLRGNFSPISSFLESELNNQEVLLFLNKKKESGSMYCKICKFNDYFERHPEICPKCRSTDIYFNVLNVDSLRKEVKKLSRNKNIDIQTATVFYSPKIQKYKVAAYIQADSLLNRSDFASAEILFSQITNLKKLLAPNGILIIQTYSKDDQMLKAAAAGNYSNYFDTQLLNRKILSYPPFALLVKLSVKGKNAEKIQDNAHKTTSELRVKTKNLPVEILGPYEPMFFSKIPTSNIIIKYKLGSFNLDDRERAIKKLSPIMKDVVKNFQITVDPQTIN